MHPVDHFNGTPAAGKVIQIHVNWRPTDRSADFALLVHTAIVRNIGKGRDPYTIFVVGGLLPLLETDPADAKTSPFVVARDHAENLWAGLVALKDLLGFDVVYMGAGLTPGHQRASAAEKAIDWMRTLTEKDRQTRSLKIAYPSIYYQDTYTPSVFKPWLLVSKPLKKKTLPPGRAPPVYEPIYQEPSSWLDEVLGRMECQIIWYSAASQHARNKWKAAAAAAPSTSKSSRSGSHHRSSSNRSRR